MWRTLAGGGKLRELGALQKIDRHHGGRAKEFYHEEHEGHEEHFG